jgi:hypothetical protein
MKKGKIHIMESLEQPQIEDEIVNDDDLIADYAEYERLFTKQESTPKKKSSRKKANPAPVACEWPESGLYAFRFDLPEPPSINDMYGTIIKHGRPVRTLKKHGRTFKGTVSARLGALFATNPYLTMAIRHGLVSLSITYYFKYQYVRDLDSGIKITIDSIYEAAGEGRKDNRVVNITVSKALSGDKPPYCSVGLTILRPDMWDWERGCILDTYQKGIAYASEHQ